MSSINWSDMIKDAEASGATTYSPLPNGDYDFKVVEAESKVSGSGKQMFKIKAAVQGGPHHGRFVWDNLVISPESPGALGYFFKKMKALGLGAEYFQSNPSNEQIVSALRDRTFRAKVGVRTWNGNEQNEIKDYLPAVSAPSAPQQAAPAPQQYAAPAPAPAPQQAAPAPAPQQGFPAAAPPQPPF